MICGVFIFLLLFYYSYHKWNFKKVCLSTEKDSESLLFFFFSEGYVPVKRGLCCRNSNENSK